MGLRELILGGAVVSLAGLAGWGCGALYARMHRRAFNKSARTLKRQRRQIRETLKTQLGAELRAEVKTEAERQTRVALLGHGLIGPRLANQRLSETINRFAPPESGE